jgi:sucrose-6-phosphate hydrolase SacC (GH32 family)
MYYDQNWKNRHSILRKAKMCKETVVAQPISEVMCDKKYMHNITYN